ncbi:MAG: class I SAM-dependent methyltransferase [Chloroflexota bacterium]|nr:MAG: class I SAM-dependent methyltransferase [Chloroflexota bacterium]
MTKKVKGYKGLPMEGPVARWYTKITYNNYDDFRAQASRLAGMTAKESRILEIAPGPGYLSIELARLGYQVTGLDISKSFVEIAQRKAAEAGCRVDFRQGDAAHMPLPDDSFDLIVFLEAFHIIPHHVNAIF